jgi:hypothetical protein
MLRVLISAGHQPLGMNFMQWTVLLVVWLMTRPGAVWADDPPVLALLAAAAGNAAANSSVAVCHAIHKGPSVLEGRTVPGLTT